MSTLARGPVTDALLAALATASVTTGDAVKPTAGGWSGQPSDAAPTFTPYCVLYPANGSPGNPTGSIADSQIEWQLAYTLTSYGVTRKQCETQADKARAAVQSLQHTTVSTGEVGTYDVQQVWVAALGNVVRVDVEDPSVFGQTDTLILWIAKE